MARAQEKLGVVLVGLGSYSTSTLAPSILNCTYCELKGIVTNAPVKVSMWTRKYNLKKENVYSYQSFDEIANNHEIDIVYIVTPNAKHLDFARRAARAKKHIICEKPLALSVNECKEIMKTCDENAVRLSVGYRLCYSPYFNYLRSLLVHPENQTCQIQGDFSFKLEDFSNWRFEERMAGGGALMDLGIYGIYLSNFLFDSVPKRIHATSFEHTASMQVESSVSFEMGFGKQRVARFNTSYLKDSNVLTIDCQSKNYVLQNAISPYGQKLYLDGKEIGIEGTNQITSHVDDFAKSILDNAEVKVPGEFGLRDAKIIESIYASARNKKKKTKLGIMPKT